MGEKGMVGRVSGRWDRAKEEISCFSDITDCGSAASAKITYCASAMSPIMLIVNQ
jgi:hypothetical protein